MTKRKSFIFFLKCGTLNKRHKKKKNSVIECVHKNFLKEIEEETQKDSIAQKKKEIKNYNEDKETTSIRQFFGVK